VVGRQEAAKKQSRKKWTDRRQLRNKNREKLTGKSQLRNKAERSGLIGDS
jgi:hypothetical protein